MRGTFQQNNIPNRHRKRSQPYHRHFVSAILPKQRSCQAAEYLNRFEGRGNVIAIASEPEPRVYWFTRKMILMISVPMSIRCTSVRTISRFRCQSALANSDQSLLLARKADSLPVEGVPLDRRRLHPP